MVQNFFCEKIGFFGGDECKISFPYEKGQFISKILLTKALTLF